MTGAARVAVWADAVQAPLVREAIEFAQLEVIAIGSPSRQGVGDLADLCPSPSTDDLRRLVQHEQIDMLWLAAAEAIEPDVCRLIIDADLLTIASQPQFGFGWQPLASEFASSKVCVVPLMRRGPGYRAAAAALPQFGEPQCVNVFFRSGPGQGALLARLYDAMDIVHSLCGNIQTINAGLAGPLPQVPDSLAGLCGHLTINMRFKSNRTACIAISDRAGSWFRGVTVLGENGCLRISDNGFEWIGQDGKSMDSHKIPGAVSPGELVGMQIKRLLGDLDSTDAPPDNIVLMSLCEASRLSCMTGQDETPSKFVEMLSRP